MSAPRIGDGEHLPLAVEPWVSFHPTLVGRMSPPAAPGAAGLALGEEPATWPDLE